MTDELCGKEMDLLLLIEKKGRAGTLGYISDVPARNQSACWTDEKLADRHTRDLHISVRGWEEGSGGGRNG